MLLRAMNDHPAIPRIEGLVDLACRDGVDIRPTLLRVLTDLYVQARSHTPAEEAQYVELALRLIDSVDDPTRRAVAARLAGYPRAPVEIVHRLRGLTGVVEATTQSETAKPADDDLSEAFFKAESYERQLILTNLDAAEPPGPRPVPPMAAETCRQIEAAVLARRPHEVARLFESTLLLPRAVAEKVVADNSGEPIVVAAKALGMAADALQRILLLMNPAIGQSVERVYELAALYDEISVRAANAMIEIWRGRMQRRRAPHQPMLWDDEQRSARAAATPSRYQSGRRTDPLSTRLRNSGR
jgi:hypothetical protein